MGFKPRSRPTRSSRPEELAVRVAAELAAGASANFAPLLDRNVSLGLWRWDGAERHQGGVAAAHRLQEDAASTPHARLEQSSVTVDGDRAAIEFRLLAPSPLGVLAHHRCAVLSARDDRALRLDIYCAEPVPEAPADDAVVPPGLSQEALEDLLVAQHRRFRRSSVRDGMSRYHSVRCRRSALADPDPLSNTILGAHWSEADADQAIDELVSWHRSRGRGISWRVNPDDRPIDLGSRLERRGFRHLVDEHSMVLRLDGRTTVPRSSEVEVQMFSGTDAEDNRIALDIVARAFEWPPATIASVARSWNDRMQPTKHWRRMHYLARVDGVAAGFATMSLRSGLALLTGAATLPTHQRRGIYTTLLAERLDHASTHGYHYATIEARPDSRAVVTRYGFETRARVAVYVLPAPPPQR